MVFNKKNQTTIFVETSTMIRAVAVIIGVLFFLAFIKAIASALIILFVSFFLALALNPAVSWIAKRLKSKSRVRATGAAYLVVLVFLVGFLSLVLPPLVRQTIDFVRDVPQTIQEFRGSDSAISRFVHNNNLDDQVGRFANDFGHRFQDVGDPVLTTAGAVGAAVAFIVSVLVLTFMMLVEGPSWFSKILAIQPKSKREKRKKLAYRIYKSVTGYVNGQLILAFLAGSFAFLALVIASSIYDASINAIALAGIVALFALLPLIGTTIGAAIVVLATLFVSTPLAITMAIFFIIYQQLENVTIQPYIQSKTSQLTPLIVLSAALIGVTFAGILGALVAIPVAASIKILLEEHYHNRLETAEKS